MIGVEAGKTIEDKRRTGFVADAFETGAILDIGYRGYTDAEPVVAQAIGIELDYQGYDGRTLPFPDRSQDAVFSSHCLEHIEDFRNAIREWHRVLKVGGFLIIAVPHQFLYEKRRNLPSRWNADHKRFYTPASLLAEVELSLAPDSYRVRHSTTTTWATSTPFRPSSTPAAATRSSWCWNASSRRRGNSRHRHPNRSRSIARRRRPCSRSASPRCSCNSGRRYPPASAHAIPRGLRARGARYLWRGPADRGGATPSVPP